MGVYFVLLNGLRVTILGNGAKKGLTNSNKDPDVTVSMLEVLLPSVMYSTEKTVWVGFSLIQISNIKVMYG